MEDNKMPENGKHPAGCQCGACMAGGMKGCGCGGKCGGCGGKGKMVWCWILGILVAFLFVMAVFCAGFKLGSYHAGENRMYMMRPDMMTHGDRGGMMMDDQNNGWQAGAPAAPTSTK